MARVDLYLGGEVGLWALRRVAPAEVGRVYTFDAPTLEAACSLGLDARRGDEADAGARGDEGENARRGGDSDALRDEADARGDEADARRDEANARGGGEAGGRESASAEFGFSVHYPRIIRPRLLAKYRKIYNLHPGYLPWGRGFYPVFWALWEGSPAGATLHEMTAELDAGPVVAQTRVAYDEDDTGGSLHARVREAEEQLFLEHWPRVAAGEELPARPQGAGGGTSRTRREFFALKERARVEELSGPRLLRLARCLTFPGHTGLEVTLGRTKFEVRLEPLAREDGADGRQDTR